MTTIIVTTILGRWDEAANRLHRRKLTLTIENTVQVEDKAIARVLAFLWDLTVEGVIGGFAVDASGISR